VELVELELVVILMAVREETRQQLRALQTVVEVVEVPEAPPRQVRMEVTHLLLAVELVELVEPLLEEPVVPPIAAMLEMVRYGPKQAIAQRPVPEEAAEAVAVLSRHQAPQVIMVVQVVGAGLRLGQVVPVGLVQME
jgi:hypothetical protein